MCVTERINCKNPPSWICSVVRKKNLQLETPSINFTEKIPPPPPRVFRESKIK